LRIKTAWIWFFARVRPRTSCERLAAIRRRSTRVASSASGDLKRGTQELFLIAVGPRKQIRVTCRICCHPHDRLLLSPVVHDRGGLV
jgi:hypothetical protein